MEDPAKVAAFGWNQTGVTAALGAVDAFLTTRAAYEADNSTAKRIAKDEAREAAKSAMRDFAHTGVWQPQTGRLRFHRTAAGLRLTLHPARAIPRRQLFYLFHGKEVKVPFDGMFKAACGGGKFDGLFAFHSRKDGVNKTRAKAVAAADPVHNVDRVFS